MRSLGLGHELVAQLRFQLHRENRLFRHSLPPATTDTNLVHTLSVSSGKPPVADPAVAGRRFSSQRAVIGDHAVGDADPLGR